MLPTKTVDTNTSPSCSLAVSTGAADMTGKAMGGWTGTWGWGGGGGGGGGALHWCRVMRGVCQKGQWEGQFMQHTLGGCHRGGPFRMGACAEYKRTPDTTMTTSAGDTLHYHTQAHTTKAIHPTPQTHIHHWTWLRRTQSLHKLGHRASNHTVQVTTPYK